VWSTILSADPEVRGRASEANVRADVFRDFGQVQFETLNPAVNGDFVIAGQAHGLALPGKPLAPVRNLAVYEIREGKIAAWHDYTNPQKPASSWACSRRTTGREHP
jgi:limonene-1,2-epoxide hydrolase